MLLVLGNAAHSDLIARVDRTPGSSEVAVLLDGPGASGTWLPGGSAPTVALVASEYLPHVRLWYPLPRSCGRMAGLPELRRAGIDLSSCPAVEDLSRCVVIESGQERLCWSSPPPAVPTPDPCALLEGVDLVVVCPRWGEWFGPVIDVASRRGVQLALIGESPDCAADTHWDYLVVDRHQFDAGHVTANVVVLTNGSGDVEVIDRTAGTRRVVPAPRISAVDTTGAGDTFAAALIANIALGRTSAAAAEEACRRAARSCLVWGSRSTVVSTAGSTSAAERARGALLGIACGDAFGMPNSFLQSPSWRTEMEPAPADTPYHVGYEAGRITDDTEQALALTDSLRKSGKHLDPGIAADDLCAWFERVGGEASLAVGPSTKRAMMRFMAGVPLAEVGITGVTNGAPMRIAPIGVWAALSGMDERALVDEVAAACMPTHNTSVAIAGAAAIAAGVRAGVLGASLESAVTDACRAADLGSAKGQWIYAPSISKRIRWACDVVMDAATDRDAVTLISELIGAGEPVSESVPAAFAAATYAGGDPHLAVMIAGNLTGDTDTVGAMAGALCGAQRGVRGFPAHWAELVSRVNNLDIDRWYGDLVTAVR